jgi:hypothetical protein
LLSVQTKVDLSTQCSRSRKRHHVSTQSPYQQSPNQSPYQQSPYQQSPYQQVPYQQAPYQSPYQPAPYQQNSAPSWFRICAVVIGTAVAAALVFLAVTLWHTHSSTAPATTHPSTSTSVPAHPTTPVKPTSPVTPTGQ